MDIEFLWEIVVLFLFPLFFHEFRAVVLSPPCFGTVQSSFLVIETSAHRTSPRTTQSHCSPRQPTDVT